MPSNYFTYLTHTDNSFAASATVVTASTASASYPAANLKTVPVAKHWRSTGVASENLQIDLGSVKSIDLIGLINHNLTSAATITVNAGATANPDGSTYTTTMSYREFDAFVLIASAQSYRYWKIIIVDPTNSDGYIKVGYVIVGAATTLSFHWRHGAQFTDRFVNLFRRTSGGVPYVEAKFGIIRHNFRFGPLTTAESSTFRTFYRALKGSAKPLFLIPERNTNDGYFGRFVTDLTRTLDFREEMTLEFEEDGRGRDMVG